MGALIVGVSDIPLVCNVFSGAGSKSMEVVPLVSERFRWEHWMAQAAEWCTKTGHASVYINGFVVSKSMFVSTVAVE
jgi:hypothetical protein